MRKLAMGLAAGAMTLALAAEAGACTYRDINYTSEPLMATLVREAHTISLARVTFVNAIPREQRHYYPNVETHEYVFEVDRHLKRDGQRFFNYRASSPFPPQMSDQCLNFDPDEYDPLNRDRTCPDERMDQRLYEQVNTVANGGRENWGRFFWVAPFHHNGQGGISPPEQGGGDCSWAESYEVGETYLVFRDADGEVVQTRGLNLQLITRDDDRWLEAVQFLIEHPEQDWLPAIPAENMVRRLHQSDVLAVTQCPGQTRRSLGMMTGTSQLSEDERRIMFIDDEQSNCQFGELVLVGQAGSIYGAHRLFPIRDGMVDLSSLPSQYRIEPSEVPLEDVISWLSEETETE